MTTRVKRSAWKSCIHTVTVNIKFCLRSSNNLGPLLRKQAFLHVPVMCLGGGGERGAGGLWKGENDGWEVVGNGRNRKELHNNA